MKNEIKRRVFLSSIVGVLLATPFAVRHFARNRPLSVRNFGKEFQKSQSRVDVPIKPIEVAGSVPLYLNPRIGNEWKYVFFSSSILPLQISHATYGEPDTFQIREGQLFIDKTPKDQIVITGGDTVYQSFSPTSVNDQSKHDVILLVQDGRLSAAKTKDTKTEGHRGLLFSHLLAMQSLPAKELALGSKWTGKIGRIHPFRKYTTHYEVVGFAEVGERKTVNIRFTATIPNLLDLPGISTEKSTKTKIKSQHRGNAFFDLETGFLVRQETEMTSKTSGVPGFGANELVTTTKFIVQLFNV